MVLKPLKTQDAARLYTPLTDQRLQRVFMRSRRPADSNSKGEYLKISYVTSEDPKWVSKFYCNIYQLSLSNSLSHLYPSISLTRISNCFIQMVL